RRPNTRWRVEAVLHEARRHLRADGVDLAEGRQTSGPLLFQPAALVGQLGLALDVHPEPSELRGEPRVLALLADGERQLAVRYDDLRGALLALTGERHRADLRGRERPGDERGQVVRPLDDIDLLPAQLLDDDLDPGPAESDARPDGIDVPLGRH